VGTPATVTKSGTKGTPAAGDDHNNTDHFSNIPLGELNSEKNKMEASLKFCLPSAVSMPMKVPSHQIRLA
jgi:hypothetical protein